MKSDVKVEGTEVTESGLGRMRDERKDKRIGCARN